MERIRSQISSIIIISAMILLGGCFEPPDLSEIPEIEFKALSFKQLAIGADSLTLRFQVKDGDGDIGLLSAETDPPYHVYSIVIDSRDSIVKYRQPAVPPFRTLDPFGNLTDFSVTDNRPPFNCVDYDRATYTDLNILDDTIFIKQNEFHNNIHVSFLKKNLATGEFSEVDFAKEFGNVCGAVSLNGRIPIFDQELLGRPLQGFFTYYMVSAGFRTVLASQTFKIRFYIYDRALNQSNIAETPEYTLAEITQ